MSENSLPHELTDLLESKYESIDILDGHISIQEGCL